MWHKLLPLLGSESQSEALPAAVTCPLCGGSRLHIFANRAHRGQWHYCFTCDSHGDMIELAAAKWNLGLEATLAKLEQLGMPIKDHLELANIAAYAEHYPGYRARMASHLDAGRKYLPTSRSLNRILNYAGVKSKIPLHRWHEHFGKLVGGCDSKKAKKLYSGARKLRVTRAKLFSGTNWANVVEIPFYSMPGFVSSNFYIGRKGDPVLDTELAFTLGSSPEVGIAMHPELWKSDCPVLAVGDPYVYLQLIARHYAHRQTILPVICWLDEARGRTHKAWEMLSRRKVAIWSPTLTAQVLRQAVESDSNLSIHTSVRAVGNDELLDYIQQVQPFEYVRARISSARPWPFAVTKTLERMTDAEVENLLGQYRLLEPDTERVVPRLGKSEAARAHRLLDTRKNLGRVVSIGRHSIAEQPDGWFVMSGKHSRELVSDARLRIERVVHHKKLNKTYYHGKVLYYDKSVPFVELRETVETSTFRWMQDLLIKSHVGLSAYDVRWERTAVTIATRLNPPELESGSGAVGWDQDQRAFNLPKFSVIDNGLIRRQPEQDNPDLPAAALSRPGRGLPPVVFERLLQNNAQMQLFWAVWVCLVANVVAEPLKRRTRGITLVGEATSRIGYLASQSIGCRHFMQEGNGTQKALVAEREHNWPLAISLDGTASREFRRNFVEATDNDRNCLLNSDWYFALVVLLNGGWNAIVDTSPMHLDESVVDDAKLFLPIYLRSLASRKFKINLSPARETADVIFEDVAHWFSRRDADPAVIVAASGAVLPSSRYHYGKIFGELLCYLINAGDLYIEPDQNMYVERTVWRIDDNIFVPKLTISKVLAAKKAPMLNAFRVTQHLATGGQLVGDTVINGQEGWLLSEKWLAGIRKSVQKETAPLLRLYGA